MSLHRYAFGNYATRKKIDKFKFYLSNRRKLTADNPPLIIYQMGKVGSSSINRSLKKYWTASPVYRVHVLTEGGLQRLDHVIRNAYAKTRFIPLHLIVSEFLRPHLSISPSKIKWNIITLVRDPIARNISSFFQDLGTRHHYFDYPTSAGNEKFNRAVEELVGMYLDNHDHARPLTWFDSEFGRTFNMDIYDYRFDREKGFSIIKEDDCRVLVLKLEALDRCAASAFQEFLKIDNFELINDNLAREKKYASLYQQFKKAIVLPEKYIEMMYNTKFVNHFYTQDEINRFRQRWSRARQCSSDGKI